MSCQICGDTQGPWEYEEYKSSNKKPWLINDGQVVLVCENCGKILRKRMRKEREQNETTNIRNKRYAR